MTADLLLSNTPPGPEITFLDEPYQVLEENGTLQVCFNVTRNSYQGDLNYTFTGGSAQGICVLNHLYDACSKFPILC